MKKFLAFLISFLGLLAIVLAVPSKPSAVHADTGPKPDMQIVISHLEKSDYIIGFGTKDMYFGPHSAYETGTEPYDGDFEDLNLVYNTVSLPEGWYLANISRSFLDTTEITIKSGYMWPSDFILILLNKQNCQYFLSEETKTYAFHSYFTFDMNNYGEGSMELHSPIVFERHYEYGKEIGEFFIRLAVTLAIELLLALAFKFTKKSFIIIAITNAVTQVGLNVVLNLSAHFLGKNLWLIFFYVFAEVLIILVETIVFMKFCERKNGKKKFPILLYTFAANALSFGLGMFLWLII